MDKGITITNGILGILQCYSTARFVPFWISSFILLDIGYKSDIQSLNEAKDVDISSVQCTLLVHPGHHITHNLSGTDSIKRNDNVQKKEVMCLPCRRLIDNSRKETKMKSV